MLRAIAALPESRPFWRRWEFWIAVTGAVVGVSSLGLGLVVARRETSKSDPKPSGASSDDGAEAVVRNPSNSRFRGLRKAEFWIAVGAAATVCTLGVGLYELIKANHLQKDQNRLQQAALDSHLGEVMMELDRHFVAYPHLRKYFYVYADKRETQPPRAGRLRAQALSAGELVIDFADDVASYVRERKMPQEDADHWAKIVGPYFDESPVTRYVWREYHDSYGSDTACILGAPFKDEMPKWHWRTNEPKPLPMARRDRCRSQMQGT